MNQNGSELESMTKPAFEKASEPPKRSYARRERKAPTFSSVNNLIEAKKLEIEAIRAEIDSLTIKRNELFFIESQEMGLISAVADPEMSKRLADLVKGYAD